MNADGILLAMLLTSSVTLPRSYVEPLTRMRFVLIPAGTFVMGSQADEPGHQPSEARHRVTIARPFYLGAREVTQREWSAVMGSNPSHFRGAELPVEEVNWFEVHEFIRRLNARGEGRFRLPTEAEWEYACRAGTTTPYAFGRTLSTVDANYDGRYPLPGQPEGQYRGRTVAAGSLRANAWGLYDMHGNVWEWCEDAFDRDRKSDSRRELVLQRRQRALRASLQSSAARSRIQPRLPAGAGMIIALILLAASTAPAVQWKPGRFMSAAWISISAATSRPRPRGRRQRAAVADPERAGRAAGGRLTAPRNDILPSS